jgi:hypothetical protein
MAYTTIKKPSDYFNTKLYTGNGSSQSITGVGFQPDLLWIKSRGGIGNHFLSDVIRGSTKRLKSNETDAEDTITSLSSFDSDGFTLSNTGYNGSGETFATWNWKANGAGVANTDGSISSTVSASATSGFSIVKYNSTRTPSAVQTVGHGLGVSPDVLIFKNLNETQNWLVWHKDIATDKHLNLNTTSALNTDSGSLNNTAPTSSVFTIAVDGRTNSGTEGNPIVCYAFAEKQGFSKFGSYKGNGNVDGTFIYTGFKPAFVMVKDYTSTGQWFMRDNKREPNNIAGNTKTLYANSNGGDDFAQPWDMLSNGFKMRNTDVDLNNSSQSYIYMAFAEQPLVGDNPATAR